MAVIETWYNQDLQQPVKVHYLDGSLFSHNGNGNRIGVHVFNNGEPVTLSGTVSGYVVTADGSTVPCTGSRSGQDASILIPAAAYQPGAIFITVFLKDGSTVTTLASVATNVLTARTGNQVSPGSVVADWTQTINGAMQDVQTAAANLGGIVATPYASLTYPVPLGKYTYYNGNLYRCISAIAASEEFTAAHWTQVRLGDDVTDLKSAFGYITGVGETIYKVWNTTQGGDISNFLDFSASAGEMLHVLVSGSGVASGNLAFAVKYVGESSYTYLDPITPNKINTITLTNGITALNIYRRNANAGNIVFVAGKTQADTGIMKFLSDLDVKVDTQVGVLDAKIDSEIQNVNTTIQIPYSYLLGMGETKCGIGYITEREVGIIVDFTASANDKLNLYVGGTGKQSGAVSLAVKYTGASNFTPIGSINVNEINIVTLSNSITAVNIYVTGGSVGYVALVVGKVNYDTGILKEINKTNSRISTLIDHGITQDNLAFSELEIPVNLFNPASEEMVTKDYWYYSTTIGATVQKVTNEYTVGVYSALTIPVPEGISKVWLQQFPIAPSAGVFWYGYVDNDFKLLSYERPSGGKVETTIPSGAKYLLIAYQSASDDIINLFVASTVETITEYPIYHEPCYLLKNCKAEYNDTQNGSVSLSVPDHYDLVVGDTFQLFFKGIINAVNDECFYVKANCSKGSCYKRLFEITPNTAETLSLNLKLYDLNGNLIDDKTVSLVIRAKKTSVSSNKVILCVGDSLTTYGQWPKELHRRLTGTGGTPEGDGLSNIQFIGTRVADGVHYEGYGGWTFEKYNAASVESNAKIITCTHDKTEQQDQHSIYKDGVNKLWKLETIESNQIKIIAIDSEGTNFPATGTLTWVSGGVNHSNIVYTASENAPGNPFWNTNSNKVDFGWYAQQMGVSTIDYVYVLLGWNSATWSKQRVTSSAQTFINNVHTSFPNAKIVLVGLEVPARDGLGRNYGASGTYSDYMALLNYVHSVDEWYDELVDDNSNVLHINLSGQFDTEYNMQTWTRQVNTRNSTTETYQSNGVHPAESGYFQIADAVYRSIEGLLP